MLYPRSVARVSRQAPRPSVPVRPLPRKLPGEVIRFPGQKKVRPPHVTPGKPKRGPKRAPGKTPGIRPAVQPRRNPWQYKPPARPSNPVTPRTVRNIPTVTASGRFNWPSVRLPKLPAWTRFARGLGWVGVGLAAYELYEWYQTAPLPPAAPDLGELTADGWGVVRCLGGIDGTYWGSLSSTYCGNQPLEIINFEGPPYDYIAGRWLRWDSWDINPLHPSPVRFRSQWSKLFPTVAAADAFIAQFQPQPGKVVPLPTLPLEIPSASPLARPIHVAPMAWPLPKPIYRPWPNNEPFSPEAPDVGPRPAPQPVSRPAPVVNPFPDTVTEPVVEIPGVAAVTMPAVVEPMPPEQILRSGRKPIATSRPHRARRTRPKTKEIKARMSPFASFVWHATGQITEFQDFVNSIYEALPWKVKVREYQKRGYQPRLQHKMEAIYRHANEIDIGKALSNHIQNEIEDAVIGYFGGKLAKANRQTPRPLGYGVGPAI